MTDFEMELEKIRKYIAKQLHLCTLPFVQMEENHIVVNLFPTPFKMIRVVGDTFLMGAQSENFMDENYDFFADECSGPVHQVTLDNYYIGETVVTQSLWKAVMGEDDPRFEFGADDLPAVGVNWYDCQRFINKLNEQTGLKFRFPTEAEWEFAARGGIKSRGYIYSGSNEMNRVGWTNHSRDRRLHPVKMKRPNELGIYDMSGNVWEWCADWMKDGYPQEPQTNPKGPDSSPYFGRVIRGGSWYDNPLFCHVSQRFECRPNEIIKDCGLRLVME